MYVEVNQHTAEKRQHTYASLQARLQALGINPARTKLPVETDHSLFRYPVDGLDEYNIPSALPNGAWGEVTSSIAGCTTCNGSGKLVVDDGAKIPCWECSGKGTVTV